MTPTERTALVTGGSRGIGRGIANALAQAGCRVAVTARSAADLETFAVDTGGVALAGDLSDPHEAADIAHRAATALGGHVDIFVHGAGVAVNGLVYETSLADWERSFAINVTAAFRIAGVLAPAMVARGWGRIVTVCSLYSRFAVTRTAAYASSKHALLGLTRVLSAELVKGGVTANAVVPGWTDTEMVREQARLAGEKLGRPAKDVMRGFLRNQPLGRMLTVDEVGALAAFLCSDAAAGITGQAIGIDGGSYQG